MLTKTKSHSTNDGGDIINVENDPPKIKQCRREHTFSRRVQLRHAQYMQYSHMHLTTWVPANAVVVTHTKRQTSAIHRVSKLLFNLINLAI